MKKLIVAVAAFLSIALVGGLSAAYAHSGSGEGSFSGTFGKVNIGANVHADADVDVDRHGSDNEDEDEDRDEGRSNRQKDRDDHDDDDDKEFRRFRGFDVHVLGNGNIVIVGTLQSISGSALVVKGLGNATWEVDASDATFARKSGGASALSELHVGDILLVRGEISGSDDTSIEADHIRDLSLSARNKVKGEIESVSTSSNSLTITTKRGDTVTVNATSGTKVFIDGEATTFSELKSGMQVKIKGLLNTMLHTILAVAIHARTN